MTSIFDRDYNLQPSQLASVAERRFGDAEALCNTNDNARANGAQYLCGLVVEILLKAQLMRQYPHIARKRPHDMMTKQEQIIWNLIGRSHELERMLVRLPQLNAALVKASQREREPYHRNLSGICATWSIYARYSSQTSTIDKAKTMLGRVRRLKELLK